MVEGVTSIIFAQVGKVEKRTAVVRIIYFLGLFALFVAFRNPLISVTIDHLLALLAFLLVIGYSVILLVFIARDSFHERLGHLSNALDAIGAAAFFPQRGFGTSRLFWRRSTSSFRL